MNNIIEIYSNDYRQMLEGQIRDNEIRICILTQNRIQRKQRYQQVKKEILLDNKPLQNREKKAN